MDIWRDPDWQAIGTWVTGAALAFLALNTWKLQRLQHDLVFNPRVQLTASEAKVGPVTIESSAGSGTRYPFAIDWTIFVSNLSQFPLLISHMDLIIRHSKEDRQSPIPPFSRAIIGNDSTPPFQVSLNTPKKVRRLVQGTEVPGLLAYLKGNHADAEFHLVCRSFTPIPQEPGRYTANEIKSTAFNAQPNANWGSATPYII